MLLAGWKSRLRGPVTPFRYVPTMELPNTHLETLKHLAGGPQEADIDPDILAELRSWGLVMPRTLELTGASSDLLRGEAVERSGATAPRPGPAAVARSPHSYRPSHSYGSSRA